MATRDRNWANSWQVRLRCRPPFRRFTREEYGELFRIYVSETRELRRRPGYLLGALTCQGVATWLLFTGLFRDDGARVGRGVLITLGFLAVVDSVREHLSERLLRLERHPEEIEDI